MSFNIENTDSFVIITDIDTGKEIKRFNCPVIIESFDANCCGNVEPYFEVNGYMISSSDIGQINGLSKTLYGGQKVAMQAVMNDCECCGGGATGTFDPRPMEEFVETSGGGIVCLASDTTRKGTLEKVRLEDNSFDKWVWSEIGSAVVLETADLSNYTICPNNTQDFEVCKSYTFDIEGAQSIDFADILTILTSAGISTSTKDFAGFEFVLKPPRGEAVSGALSSTSEASSTGANGERNLDAGGKFKVDPQRLPDNTFRRLDNQEFTVSAGSVAVLTIQYI